MKRRSFLRLTAAAGALAGLGMGTYAGKSLMVKTAEASQGSSGEAKKRLGMFIDGNGCVGCNMCTIACNKENNVGPTVTRTRVMPIKPDNTYITMACQHCDRPPCVFVCPITATYLRDRDGIVMQVDNKCMGCKYCMTACPYAVRSFNKYRPFDDPSAHNLNPEVPVRPRNVVEKCSFCDHRTDRGETPACVEACPVNVRFFGNIDDPDSEISQVIRNRNAQVLRPSQGTRPKVFFAFPYNLETRFDGRNS
ncbi:4Fe-4S dicluster domain-containing protein [Desulfurispira natronophila]|uniref:Molybdopterin-containing oxidoreductase family iron-sulfur binding subunit n=1 Tax=Desulfurispira natronophila TaxID=682562 RepID=A0A7W7Y3C2_9BACT|nr:4Fe-4S dicluster domain-containing protein [Desulfurispira natronophila]MBB5021307.1 molybdopterin-containing oxidoreductase family iron-sulfur binding subunit [Desulfurispira natronophila]